MDCMQPDGLAEAERQLQRARIAIGAPASARSGMPADRQQNGDVNRHDGSSPPLAPCRVPFPPRPAPIEGAGEVKAALLRSPRPPCGGGLGWGAFSFLLSDPGH